MKECSDCGGKKFIFLPYQGQSLCKGCFSKMIEKRIRHNLRNKKIIDERPMLVVDDVSAASGAAKFVLEKISKVMPKLKIRFSEKPKKGFKTVVCKNIEGECISFLEEVFKGKKTEGYPNPTCNIPQKELVQFCKINKIKFKEHKYSQIDSDILEMLNQISDIRPGTFFSVQRISERLR